MDITSLFLSIIHNTYIYVDQDYNYKVLHPRQETSSRRYIRADISWVGCSGRHIFI